MFPGLRETAHMVLPVRGASWLQPETPELAALQGRPWPERRFEISVDRVRDRLTGLVWSNRILPEQGEASWQGALDAAVQTDGWRLPTIWELESLVDVSRAWPALPQGLPFVQGGMACGLPPPAVTTLPGPGCCISARERSVSDINMENISKFC